MKKYLFFSVILLSSLFLASPLLAQVSDNLNIGLTVTDVTGPIGGGNSESLISGWIYHDLDLSGSRHSEPGLSGWQVELYRDGNLVATTETFGENGIYFFNDLDPATYQVCEILADNQDWFQTDPLAHSGSSWRSVPNNYQCSNGTYGYEVNISHGDDAYGFDFGNTYGQVTVPNVNNFTATPSSGAVNLNWENPDFPNLEAVRIVRLEGSIPLDPNDGELIYEGSGESIIDNQVITGVTYYYAAFVRSTTGQYSSGAIASAILITPEEQCVGPDCEEQCVGPDCEEERPPVTENPTDVFDHYPTVIDQSLPVPTLLFIQPSRGAQSLSDDKTVNIDGREELTVFLPVGAVPAGLKTIGLTLFAPDGSGRSFGFILRLNTERTGYSATIAPLGVSGNYDFVLHIINFKNQQIQKINGALIVEAGIGQLPLPKNTGNLAIGVGVVVGLTQLVVVASQAKSLAEIYLIILRGISALLGYAGFKRRSQPWGTVYDSVTKRPIDPAVVTVEQNGQEINSAITDIDGRYGFFLPAGTYVLKAGKTNYRFPSQYLAGQENDPLYSNLYFGQPINLEQVGEIVARNIPLDPVGFDWNEFIKNKGEYFKLATRRKRWQAIVFNGLYLLGFMVAVAHTLTSPSITDFVILVVYLAIAAAQSFWKYRYPVVSVKRRNGEPLSYSVIKVFLSDLNQEVKKVVTDQWGQFYLLLRPGEYYFTVEEKLADTSYKEVYRSLPLTLKTGVLKKDLIVP